MKRKELKQLERAVRAPYGIEYELTEVACVLRGWAAAIKAGEETAYSKHLCLWLCRVASALTVRP